MANFHRLIFLLLLLSFNAMAETPVTQYNGKNNTCNQPSSWLSTADAAGPDAVATRNCTYPALPSCSFHHVADLTVYGDCGSPQTGKTTDAIWTISTRQWCVTANVLASGGTCPNPVDCASKAGTTHSSGKYNFGASILSSMPNGCDGGCSTYFQGSYPDYRFLAAGVYNYGGTGSYVYEGSTCTAGTGSPASSQGVPPDTCPPGQVLGTLNGNKMCVNGGVPQNPNPAPAPITPSVTQSTATNPDGSTTTTTVSTAGDGSKTTTITNTPAGGGQSTTTTKTDPAPSADPKDDYCKNNPSAPICKSSKFGGGCGVFSCEGDAIQCAIAREQHQRNCVLYDTATPLSDLGNALAAGTDSGVDQNPAKASNRQTVDLPGTLNTSKSISAVCMPDLTVQVMSTSLVIPFSIICPYLEIMGRIVIAFSLIAAGRIISGGVA